MAAAIPEIDLREPKPREAPFLYRIQRRIEEYALLARLDRPIGTWLLMWPALWGLWIAGAGRPHPRVLLVFVAGVFGYLFFVSGGTQELLNSAFPISNGMIWFFLAASLVSALLSKLKPRWEMTPLIGLGGVAAFF